MFEIGDKVICIEKFTGCYYDGEKSPGPKPIKGEIYTVDGWNTIGNLYLEELNYINSRGGRICFNEKKFRKLSDIQSEELLNEIIKQIKEEELVLKFNNHKIKI